MHTPGDPARDPPPPFRGGARAPASNIRLDVWLFDLAVAHDEFARLERYCSDDERRRSRRFLARSHARRYLAGRGRLREVLAGYLGVRPASLQFSYERCGKPRLALDGACVYFNVSHCCDIAAVAVCRDSDVGIDIELQRPVEHHVATHFFSPAEIEHLERVAHAEWTATFMRCWTRKEAYLKLRGCGLLAPLDSFSVPLDPGTHGRGMPLRCAPRDEFRFFGFVTPDDGIGAVCMATGDRPVDLRVLQPGRTQAFGATAMHESWR